MIDEISLRRRALLAEVTRLASGVGAAIRDGWKEGLRRADSIRKAVGQVADSTPRQ